MAAGSFGLCTASRHECLHLHAECVTFTPAYSNTITWDLAAVENVPKVRKGPAHDQKLLGFAGGVSAEDAKQIYGQTTDDAAEQEARRLTRSFTHPGRYVVSAGDVVSYDGRYIGHRASCNRGSSGGALRPVDRPGLFYGTHLGPGGAEQATVKALIVSMPIA